MRDRSKARPPFAPVNRNFCNYPLARDRHILTRWRQSRKTGRWLCDLKGDEQIQLRLPAETTRHHRRCPTAFDLNILFALLATARFQKTNAISFVSFSALLDLVGYKPEARNRSKCKDSLLLWSTLSIRFMEWYAPNQAEYIDQDGNVHARYMRGTRKRYKADNLARRELRQLPPPITINSARNRPLRISINREWIELSQSYFAKIPIPLPRDAAAQNLVVVILTSRQWRGDYGELQTHPRKVRPLCRKIGLEHNNRASKLRRTIASAQQWFKMHAGELTCVWPEGSNELRFIIFKEPLTKRKNAPVRHIEVNEDTERREEIEFEAEMAARGVHFDDADDAQNAFRAHRKRREMEKT